MAHKLPEHSNTGALETRSVTIPHPIDPEHFLEFGTVTGPDGTEHTAHGAMIAAELAVVYVGKLEETTQRYTLTTWGGEPLGTGWIVSTYRRRRWMRRPSMEVWRAIINGRDYYGRKCDDYDLLKLRAYTQQ